jgi:3-oxocholest-4-en-26-oyl-CoA dehydrogenase alpha subunit
VDFGLTDEQLDFLIGLRSVLSTPEVAVYECRDEADALEHEGDRAFFALLHASGWLGVSWPEEHGGRGAGSLEQWLTLEELSHRRLPRGDLTLSSIGPALMRFGTPEQRAQFLPGILEGSVVFAVGYSEPDAGSDLASLTTRARPEGEGWVVEGRKVFITSAHYATHVWLAARTGPPGSGNKGISVFVVPVDAPGVSVVPMRTEADGLTNEVVLDAVHLPAAALVGDLHGGWGIIRTALDFERNFPYAGLARDFEELVDWAGRERPDGTTPLDDAATCQALCDFAADVEVARLLAARAAWCDDAGETATAPASMSKVWTSELRQRLAGYGMRLLGPAGQLRTGSATEGVGLEHIWRWAPMMRIGGGVNEIQRDLVASRGLGMPRG